MKKSKFVNKIYDAYIKQDFSIGDDNLNPKREITKSQRIDPNEELDAIRNAMKQRIETIKARWDKFDDNVKFNANGGKPAKGASAEMKNAIARAGGDGDSLILIPGDSEDDAIIDSIKVLMLRLQAVIGEDDGFTGVNLYNIDCNGQVDLISGEEINDDDSVYSDDTSGSNSKSPNSNNSDDDNSDDDSDDSGSDSGSGDKDKDSDSDKDDSDEGTDVDETPTDTERENEEALEEWKKTKAAIAEHEDKIKECAKADFGILKIILIIFQVIAVIRALCNPTLQILGFLASIINLAQIAWIDPPAMSELQAKMITMIISVIASVISTLITLLWDLLGLDCISQNTKTTLAQIRQAIAGITSLIGTVNNSALQFQKAAKEIKQNWDDAEKALKQAWENVTNFDKMAADYDISKAYQSMKKDISANWKTYGAKALVDGAEQSGALKEMRQIQNQAKAVRAAAKSTAKAAMKKDSATRGLIDLVSNMDNPESK